MLSVGHTASFQSQVIPPTLLGSAFLVAFNIPLSLRETQGEILGGLILIAERSDVWVGWVGWRIEQGCMFINQRFDS